LLKKRLKSDLGIFWCMSSFFNVSRSRALWI